MGFQFLIMTNTYPDFYRLVGPFLARRAIAKEMAGSIQDGVIWDDDGKQWFVAMQGEEVAGFGTMLIQSRTVLFPESYVLLRYRHQGIHTRLVDERIARCPVGSTIRVLVCSASAKQYEARGFTVKRQRGKHFTEMMKAIEG